MSYTSCTSNSVLIFSTSRKYYILVIKFLSVTITLIEHFIESVIEFAITETLLNTYEKVVLITPQIRVIALFNLLANQFLH